MTSLFELLQKLFQQFVEYYAAYKAGQYKEAKENAEEIKAQVADANRIRDNLDTDPELLKQVRERYRESPKQTGSIGDSKPE